MDTHVHSIQLSPAATRVHTLQPLDAQGPEIDRRREFTPEVVMPWSSSTCCVC